MIQKFVILLFCRQNPKQDTDYVTCFEKARAKDRNPTLNCFFSRFFEKTTMVLRKKVLLFSEGFVLIQHCLVGILSGGAPSVPKMWRVEGGDKMGTVGPPTFFSIFLH